MGSERDEDWKVIGFSGAKGDGIPGSECWEDERVGECKVNGARYI